MWFKDIGLNSIYVFRTSILRSQRLKNHVISAIERFGISAHRSRRQTHRGDRIKQHGIKVIDVSLRISTCSHTRMDQCNLISVHSISILFSFYSTLSVWDASMRSLCNKIVKKRTEISTFICDQHVDILFIAETTW